MLRGALKFWGCVLGGSGKMMRLHGGGGCRIFSLV